MILEADSIYQIFVRNFTDEGTFLAAIPHLKRIASMGFRWIYLTPIHPIGKASRKGSLGSPYAIYDYRAINPDLGSEADLAAFIKEAHAQNLKIMMDVVYNHMAPDSVLVQEHPEWFLRGLDGKPWRKCEGWSDVVDFDYQSSPELWIQLIDTLAVWRDKGVDGFRCDVASLVPAEFWKQARLRVNQYDPGTRKERHALVWLAESVHPAFLRSIRYQGFGGWSEPELHAAAFDLTYDYDGWERLEKIWNGKMPIERYFEYLYAQETLYPKGAKKLRYLENHDQERAARRFGRGSERLKAWTAVYQFLPGVAMTYMGQELALEHTPDLFEKDTIDRSKGDAEFEGYFGRVMRASRVAKERALYFSWMTRGQSVLCLRSVEPATQPNSIDANMVSQGNYLLIAKIREEIVQSETFEVEMDNLAPFDVCGEDLMSGDQVRISKGSRLPQRPAMLISLDR